TIRVADAAASRPAAARLPTYVAARRSSESVILAGGMIPASAHSAAAEIARLVAARMAMRARAVSQSDRVSIAKAAAERNASAPSSRAVNARILAERIARPAANARNADLRTASFRETNRIANRV